MPCSYVIDKERGLVLTTASGRITFEEVKAHQDQLRVDPEFNPEFRHLVDALGVTAVDASIPQVKTIARQGIFSPSARRAFVAASPEVFAIGRLLGTYLEMARVPQQVHVFYDMPAALKWLGLEEDPRRAG